MGRSGLRKEHESNPFLEEVGSMVNRDMLILCKLKRSGVNMLDYLLRNGNVYEGKFLIYPKEYLKAMGLTATKSFYLGIDNLIVWDIIAKSSELNFYYINAKFFPNVNR